MAWSGNNVVSLPAGAGLSDEDDRYSAVTINNSGQAVKASAAGNRIVGALYELPTSGTAGESACGVAINGIVTLIASAAITAGQGLVGAANGRVAGAALASTHNAVALEGASAGESFRALMI